MPLVMTEKQFAKWAKEVGDRLPKYGWIPAWKKIGAYLKKQHNIRLRKHIDPDGKPWKKTWHVKVRNVGQFGTMLLDSGRHVTQRIRSSRGKRRAKAYLIDMRIPMKPEKALVRTTGKRKTRTILDYLVGGGAAGRSIRISMHKMEYGFKGRFTIWAKKHQFGRSVGTSRRFEGAVNPKRKLVGLNQADEKAITEIMADFVKRRLKKNR